MWKKYTLFTRLCFIIIAGCSMVCVLIALDVFPEEEENIPADKFVYDGLNISDPFISLFDKAKDSKESGLAAEEEFLNRLKKIKVNGILWDEAMPLVMINNQIYQKASNVEGILIQDITAESVIFNYNGLSEEISLVQKDNPDVQGGPNEDEKEADVE